MWMVHRLLTILNLTINHIQANEDDDYKPNDIHLTQAHNFNIDNNYHIHWEATKKGVWAKDNIRQHDFNECYRPESSNVCTLQTKGTDSLNLK